MGCTDCGKPWSGPVRFCPFCGTPAHAEYAGAERPRSLNLKPITGPTAASAAQAASTGTAKASPSNSPESPAALEVVLNAKTGSPTTLFPEKQDARSAAQASHAAGIEIVDRAMPALSTAPPQTLRPRFTSIKLLIGASVLMSGGYFALSAYQNHLKSGELQRFIDERVMRANASIDGGRLKEADALVTEILSRHGDNAVARSLRERIAVARRDASSQANLARRSLAKRDITSARRAAEIVRERDAESADYARLNADLVPREQQRDRLVDDARNCANNGDRACALTLIERALQIDRESPVKEIWTIMNVQVETQPASAVPSPAPSLPVAAAPPAVAPAPALSLEKEKSVECAAYVRNGRRALQSKSYDQAIASADDALNSRPDCPGARELKADAEQALQQARSIPVLN